MRGYHSINEELRELLSLLNSHGVEFIIVGAHALAFHGVPRFTEDIDFFVSRSRLNVVRLAAALRDFGVELTEEAQAEMETTPRGVIFVGQKPNRADFLNFLDGLSFESAFEAKVAGSLSGLPVFFLSLPDFIQTKQASGRPKDVGDLALLKGMHPNSDPES